MHNPGKVLFSALAALFGTSLGLLALELACQAYTHTALAERSERLKARLDHYYIRSDNPILGYELKPNFRLEIGGKQLLTNHYGIRAAGDDLFPARRRIALIGDSVVFGVGHSQQRTISALLSGALAEDEPAAVFNWGVPGYGVAEVAEFLRTRSEIYQPHEVIYLFNPNDFARRDSVYEGADNGLYRLYRPATLQTPVFLRKAIYRLYKDGSLSASATASERWYRWLYRGNVGLAVERLAAMQRLADLGRFRFSVVALPAGSAYRDGAYRLGDTVRDLLDRAAAAAVSATDAGDLFAEAPARYFDPTDHLSDDGNVRLAEWLAARRTLTRPALSRAGDR